MLKINELREMIKMVEESTTIQRIEHETTRIIIVKNDQLSTKSTMMKIETPNENINIIEEKIVSEIKMVSTENDQENHLHKITSPILGTFYSAPEPGAEPFVKIGQKVTANAIVCVLESMKLFIDIEAGIDCEIVEIMVKDGDFVEYGQPLVLVRKGG
jgi:acetyl-CoA carboxylase biotin carboxyl carrier protein